MTKKQRRNFEKQLRRKSPPSAKAVEPMPPSVPALGTLSFSPEQQQRLLAELGDIAAEINRLFHRASLKLMVEGLRAGTDPSK